jgi:hypothetical protein
MYIRSDDHRDRSKKRTTWAKINFGGIVCAKGLKSWFCAVSCNSWIESLVPLESRSTKSHEKALELSCPFRVS